LFGIVKKGRRIFKKRNLERSGGAGEISGGGRGEEKKEVHMAVAALS